MDYDRFTSNVRFQYEAYLNELVAAYLALTSAGRGHDGVSSLRNTAYRAQAVLIANAIGFADDYLALHPHGDAAARRDAWLTHLRQIATKNLNDLIVKLMGVGARPADLFSRPAGAVGLLLQQKLAKPRLTARDDAGRAWATDKLVATMAREFAYNAYLEHAIERMQQDGVEFAQVVYPDPGHERHGLVLRLSELNLVRRTIFHPNSHAQLVPHVPTE